MKYLTRGGDMDLEKLYQSTILEYSRDKSNKKDLKNANLVERGHNPSCGDDLSLLVEIDDDIIKDASFLGNGCAISTASCNMLIEQIKGISLDEAERKLEIFFKMISGDDQTEDELDEIEDARILEFVSTMPARVKCASLSWHSLKVIINKTKKQEESK